MKNIQGLPQNSVTSLTDFDELKNYKNAIDHSIAENYYINSALEKSAAERDFEFMPSFIARANNKDSDLNGHFIPEGIFELTKKIEELRGQGVKSARFVVNVGRRRNSEGETTGRMRYHFCAFDYSQNADGKSSLIGIEPAKSSGPGAIQMMLQLDRELKNTLPDIQYALIESDIQKSEADCGIFSLAFVKKMSQEKDAFGTLHEKNINGELPRDDDTCVVYADQAYGLLPASLMKHGHGRSTLDKFLLMQPQAARETVSNKLSNHTNEKYTLESWRNDRLVKRVIGNGESRNISRSIELKRQKEVDKLMMAHDIPQTANQNDRARFLSHLPAPEEATGAASLTTEMTEPASVPAKNHRVRNAFEKFFNGINPGRKNR